MTELSFITLLCWIAIIALTYDTLFSKLLIMLGVIYIPLIDGWEEDKIYTHDKVTTRTLVSAQPSHTQINGNISGNFLMFSGVIGEQRVYLLREEIEKGLYKDFEVKYEVYIREDKSLTSKGKFKQYFKCYKLRDYFSAFDTQVLSRVKYECEYQKQEIVVPVGSVIKELNI